MGGLLEALWGYYSNVVLSECEGVNYEIAWFPSHHFHDFACVFVDLAWNPDTKEGELFRTRQRKPQVAAEISSYGAAEATSSKDESKKHWSFDVLQRGSN